MTNWRLDTNSNFTYFEFIAIIVLAETLASYLIITFRHL